MTTMDRDEAMDASAIADYLKQNPAFFEQYADLLAEIFVPHPHGGRAIPIAERQIVTLREKNAQLETKLEELIQFGTENDAISDKLHRSTLALFAAPDLETTLGVLYHSLLDDFRVPQVALRLWGKVPEQSYLPELAATSQHRVPVRRLRHVIDEVDDAVFEPAGVEAVDDVHDQRWHAHGGAPLYLRFRVHPSPAGSCLYPQPKTVRFSLPFMPDRLR